MDGATHSTLLVLLLILLSVAAGSHLAAATSTPTDFIRSSCRATRYPDLCVQCLSSYAPTVNRSPRQLALAALTVSTDRARAAASFVSRLSVGGSKSIRSREAGAIRDCIETMADSVDRLRRSVDEMSRLGRAGSPGFKWHMSNVQTWASAALTDENTCLDSLSEGGGVAGNVRASIRAKVVEVGQVTSNALALVNRIGSRN